MRRSDFLKINILVIIKGNIMSNITTGNITVKYIYMRYVTLTYYILKLVAILHFSVCVNSCCSICHTLYQTLLIKNVVFYTNGFKWYLI